MQMDGACRIKTMCMGRPHLQVQECRGDQVQVHVGRCKHDGLVHNTSNQFEVDLSVHDLTVSETVA
eukprot:CAMPEP_0174322872 /NCGR_PEP_ID=MMETSP0810-20121108/11353_1 /TAXON_ID=73025 ORGANISM="Eutreptiella gymnastica-like, Strain CCMP1594" /NCGR_SAMPLE_ID=MMETSP0810 /ASSEMBLY_ACC=CAM_ASM_000659 /LENGTH=65 /DNA_ID=CAMNT_0015434957 /DNA_START=211 /DNA_END=405 /DNA_ORIENTATION=+